VFKNVYFSGIWKVLENKEWGLNNSLNLLVCKYVKKKFFSKHSTPESHITEMYNSFINLSDYAEASPVMLQGVYNF